MNLTSKTDFTLHINAKWSKTAIDYCTDSKIKFKAETLEKDNVSFTVYNVFPYQLFFLGLDVGQEIEKQLRNSVAKA